MSLSLMSFLAAVSLLAAPAAWLADRGLRGLGVPGRHGWLGALALGPVVWTLDRFGASRAPNGGSDAILPIGVIELPELVATSDGGGDVLPLLATVLWAGSTLVFLGLLLRGRLLLRRDAEGWRPMRLLGRNVWIGTATGPAVAGIVRPRIVLPEWVLALPERQVGLILAHEEEHVRAGDQRLLAFALTLVGATPWNPISWWLLHRLRGAIEIDCDRRVLRREPSPLQYGESLLAVAARAGRPPLALAAFTEPPHALERRIIAMTDPISFRTRTGGAALLAVAVLLAAQACGVDSPVAQSPTGDDGVSDTRIPADLASPTFTPFTAPPEITNRAEVIAAMERNYPPLLRDAGVEGSVRVYFLILDTGEVADVLLDMSSGHEALDRAALAVARVYRFTPALNRDQNVPVWVSLPITFRVS